ncbi:hypothetical protein [Caulobacter sp. BP25]|uniref:hypothetical protein n=1 Tax=Caulobacter sp. BP25 TaxID=2048900 RepID=UPI000C129E38|nr:hypothetical protein [Caulobacter sp. BP25]PHY18480.1 hypothetical protein CSW59_17260 [Caulobacter sp. BP25]
MSTPLDLYTVAAAGAGFLALALRGNMLKPEIKPWSSSRAASIVVLGLSVVMAGAGIDVWIHGGATPREAWIVTAVTAAASAMLTNLWAQGRARPDQLPAERRTPQRRKESA